jgi:HK97 family phage portal protein
VRSLRQVVAGWLAPALPYFGGRIAGTGTAAAPLDGCSVGWETARALAAVERACMLYANGLLLPRSIVDTPQTGGQKPVVTTDAARALADVAADDLMIAGYCAALIGFGALRIVRNQRGGPQSLSFVAPWRCSIERAVSGSQLYVRIAADMAIGEPEVVVPLSDVIVLRWRPSPVNPLLSESPVSAISPALAAALRIRDTQAAILRAASLPALTLETDQQLGPETLKDLRTQWEERYGGEGQGKTAILAWGLSAKVIPIGSAVDLQLSESFRDYIAEIGRAWGVPNTLLNEHSDSAYNSAVVASRSFVLHSLLPFLNRAADEFSRKLLTPAERAAGRRVTFDVQGLTLEPGAPTAEYLKVLVDAGILSINEARNVLNYADRPGADDVPSA